ncbi:trichohyalin [Lucilia cuprina]|uniref:trichohyalin n=1 Tax=Lucilia cuprina TaxID=7375 RepID=UPI001F06D02B|nr:trichohyalin [Lucilia cuprina]
MWLYLLSILAIESVQSVAIGYPYRSLWTYNPAQGQYAQKGGSLQGYLRYLDNNGAEALVGYNNAQPVYAVHQIKYINSAAPALETFVINKSDDTSKNREAYLRAASLQQYQNLKRDIDALKSEGKEPTVDALLKLQTLEKIAFASDFSLIAELPEVKRILQEVEASISGVYRESVQQSSNQQSNIEQNQGEIKTYIGNSNIPLVAIEETPEQKQAREEHLRIYNEQIAHLKQLELEHQKYVQETSLKSKIPQSRNVEKPTVEQIDNSKALAELERAQQEHFRLWNEAKLRAEQAGNESGEKSITETAKKQQISALTNDQNIYNPTKNIPNTQISGTQNLHTSVDKNVKSSISSLDSAQQQVVDTPEVLKAREEHLRLVDQVKLQNEQINQDLVGNEKATVAQNLKTSISTAEYSNAPQNVVDTPEVVRAREEHLRIVNEAIQRARANEQEEQKSQNIYSISEKEKAKLHSENNSQNIPSAQSQGSSPLSNFRVEQPLVVETPEVVKAREEHLRLVHEANLRAQYVEQQELKYKYETQTPILTTQYEHQKLVHNPAAAQIIQETPEVVKAREEHLHLVNQAKLNDKRIIFPSEEEQQSAYASIVEETPEVQRAREEHLRIFNAIKSHAEQQQANEGGRSFPSPALLQNPQELAIAEESLLELERLREAERLQKEQQLLELDRIREAERLAEEKKQMEAELIRLRLEEEQRSEMESLLEIKRLQQEQEELKNGEYQEIIIQNESADQQGLIAIMPTTQPLSTNIGQVRSQQSSEVKGQQIQKYGQNPFLKLSSASSESANRLEHSASQSSSILKATPVENPSSSTPTTSTTSNSAAQSSDNTLPATRYVPSSHQSSGSKHQYVKDDNIKHKYHHNTASPQPADTAVAFSAWEKAAHDHFRAHELALEQLRLARLQNPSVKDCN